VVLQPAVIIDVIAFCALARTQADKQSWFSEAEPAAVRFSLKAGTSSARWRTGDQEMTQEQKIIRAKVGLLELAKQSNNVSQACKLMDFSRDSFCRFKDLSLAACTF
jgi:hypothetical protein